MPLPAEPAALLRAMFDAAVDAARPERCLPPHLPDRPAGRTIVVGAGKASAEMARVVEAEWDGPIEGVVVTRYGHGASCRRIEILEASHPEPDEAGEAAARRILQTVAGAGPNDLVLFLVSGGGSALLPLPAPGLTLADKQAVNRALLRSGAAIGEINAVRKHLSAIKGGRLARAAMPARLVTLAISDVPGDDPSVIASGPTVADPTGFGEARAILARYGIEPPAAIAAHLAAAAEETPKPGDPAFERAEFRLIATPQTSLEAAAAIARAAGVTPLILSDRIEGEAREVARVLAGIALQAATHGQPAPPPCVLISGGETTVTVRGKGRGGRNTELILALSIALDAHPRIWALAADTDGIDGIEANAGALTGPATLARAAAMGMSAKDHLADNDGYGYFAALADLVVTGPTRTNVNDFRAILIAPP